MMRKFDNLVAKISLSELTLKYYKLPFIPSSIMASNHSYPPTGPSEPNAESLQLLTQISHATTGQDPQAQILAIVNGLLDIRLNQHNQILEKAYYRELNARDEAWEKRPEEAQKRELALQAELAALRGRLDQP